MSNINVVRKNLGPVTAYKYAVQQGYTGTEQEFAALMASYATVAEGAAGSASSAAASAAEAAASAAEAAESARTLTIDDTLTEDGQAAGSKVVGKYFANTDDFETSVFKNPITFSTLTQANMWTFGWEIVANTGANAVNSKACRTAYVDLTEPVLIVLDNADYVFVVWTYSSKSISGAVYSPVESYINKPLIILPKSGSLYFRIGVKRADGAVLTTDYSDTSSDAYKIITATKTYIMNGRMCVNKIACFGDSIMLGRDGNGSGQARTIYTIPKAIGKRLDCVCDNYAVSGQGYVDKKSVPGAYSAISAVDLTQYNAVVMCFSVDDGYHVLGEWNSTDETTIMGQFNKIINYIYTQNKQIRVIVFAPFNGRNVGTFPDYWYGERNGEYVSRKILSDTLKRACDYYWIPYVEPYDCPINPLNITEALPDGTNPSNDYYRLLSDWVAAKVNGLL